MRPSLLILAMAMAVTWAPARAQDRAATTSHPPLPAQPSRYWLAPVSAANTRTAAGAAQLAKGVRLIEDDQFTAALPVVSNAAVAGTPLAQYGRYYTAVALIELGRVNEARVILNELDDRAEGYLKEAVPLRRAQAALTSGDAETAAEILDDLSDETLIAPEMVFLRLGQAYEADAEPDKALEAYRRV